MDYQAVPGAIFTSPEIGTVGLSEEEAKEKGIDYEVGSFPFAASGKVMAMGEREGKIKLITEKESDKIIGAALIGIEASDLIAELTLAVNLGLTAENLRETIHAHPTTAEVVHEAALDLGDGSLNA
jgi:dihydrolipoamide dehydrogenase